MQSEDMFSRDGVAMLLKIFLYVWSYICQYEGLPRGQASERAYKCWFLDRFRMALPFHYVIYFQLFWYIHTTNYLPSE